MTRLDLMAKASTKWLLRLGLSAEEAANFNSAVTDLFKFLWDKGAKFEAVEDEAKDNAKAKSTTESSSKVLEMEANENEVMEAGSQ